VRRVIRILTKPGQVSVWPEEQPAFGDGHDCLPLFAHVAQIEHDFAQCIKRVALVSSGFHFLDRVLLIWHGIARVVIPVSIVFDQRLPCSPWPRAAETIGHDDGLSREHDVGSRHPRRHDPDEVVGSEQAIDETDQWLARVPGTTNAYMRTIQEEDEHPVSRIGHQLLRGADAAWLRSLGLGTGRRDQNMLEGFDLLRLVVFEDLEFFRLQIEYGLAVMRRVGIDADEICLGPKDLGRLILLLRGARLRESDDAGPDGEYKESEDAAAHRSPLPLHR